MIVSNDELLTCFFFAWYGIVRIKWLGRVGNHFITISPIVLWNFDEAIMGEIYMWRACAFVFAPKTVSFMMMIHALQRMWRVCVIAGE